MDTTEPVNATQPDNEYDNQLVWDDDLQEPIGNEHPNKEMEKAKEAGEKKSGSKRQYTEQAMEK
eukprot:3940025-Ditylum_brightwellii.AAC.1